MFFCSKKHDKFGTPKRYYTWDMINWVPQMKIYLPEDFSRFCKKFAPFFSLLKKTFREWKRGKKWFSQWACGFYRMVWGFCTMGMRILQNGMRILHNGHADFTEWYEDFAQWPCGFYRMVWGFCTMAMWILQNGMRILHNGHVDCTEWYEDFAQWACGFYEQIVRWVSPEPRRHVHCAAIKGDYKEAQKVTRKPLSQLEDLSDFAYCLSRRGYIA